MKTVMLLRHAKSSWDDPTLQDFDRPLNERGLKAAPRIGKYLKRHGLKPELIVSSPAKRARETIDLVAKAADLKSEVTFDERVYDASVGQLIQVLKGIDDSVGEILLVGHNMAMENLLGRLTGENLHMATASLAVIHLPVKTWAELDSKRGKLEAFVKAKELEGA